MATTMSVSEQDGMKLFRDFVRHFPRAQVEDYYKNGRWLMQELEVDLELVVAHRQESGAPEPPPLEEIPEPKLPAAHGPSRLHPGKPESAPAFRSTAREAPPASNAPNRYPARDTHARVGPGTGSSRPPAVVPPPAPRSASRAPATIGATKRGLSQAPERQDAAKRPQSAPIGAAAPAGTRASVTSAVGSRAAPGRAPARQTQERPEPPQKAPVRRPPSPPRVGGSGWPGAKAPWGQRDAWAQKDAGRAATPRAGPGGGASVRQSRAPNRQPGDLIKTLLA